MNAVSLKGRLVCVTTEEAEVVERHLPLHIALTRAEPGCVRFVVEQTDDLLVWSVSEVFVDRAAFASHQSRVVESEWGRATVGIERDYVIEATPDC